jgi:signal transduction histidine kinase
MAHAEAANRAKDDFLAMVSHELRTPLTAVLAWVHALRTEGADAAQAEHALVVIERNTKLQGRLIEELLDTARMTTGHLEIRQESVDLAFVVGHVAELLGVSARSRGIELKVGVDRPLRLLGDDSRLEQVVTNLVSNAIKFTPPGGHVEIELRQYGSLARLTVRDSGMGIDAALLPHIFEPFRQGNCGRRRHEGLGLGLAIARHLVRLHGGIIQADSAGPGRGATFVVELPLAAAGA